MPPPSKVRQSAPSRNAVVGHLVGRGWPGWNALYPWCSHDLDDRGEPWRASYRPSPFWPPLRCVAGAVYLARRSDGLVKLGFSRVGVERRLADLVGSFELLGVLSTRCALGLEKHLHAIASRQHVPDLTYRREMFAFNDRQLASLLSPRVFNNQPIKRTA